MKLHQDTCRSYKYLDASCFSFIEIVVFDIIVVAELVVFVVVQIIVIVVVEFIIVIVKVIIEIIIIVEVVIVITHIVFILIEIFVIIVNTIIEMDRRAKDKSCVFYRAFSRYRHKLVFRFSRCRCAINGGHRSILPHFNIEKFQGLRTMLSKSLERQAPIYCSGNENLKSISESVNYKSTFFSKKRVKAAHKPKLFDREAQ